MGETAGPRGGSSRPVLDPGRLDSLREIDPGLAAEVAEVWLRTTPAVLEQVTTAAAAGDGAALTSAVHALRGSSANVGADALADACAELEQAQRSSAALGAVTAAVQREHARAAEALAAVVAAG